MIGLLSSRFLPSTQTLGLEGIFPGHRLGITAYNDVHVMIVLHIESN